MFIIATYYFQILHTTHVCILHRKESHITQNLEVYFEKKNLQEAANEKLLGKLLYNILLVLLFFFSWHNKLESFIDQYNCSHRNFWIGLTTKDDDGS